MLVNINAFVFNAVFNGFKKWRTIKMRFFVVKGKKNLTKIKSSVKMNLIIR